MVALVLPRFGWRAVFFAGVVPALLALWLRSRLREKEAWQKERTPRSPTQGQLFPRRIWLQHARLCHHECGAALFAWWGLFTWVPRFLSMPTAEGGRGLSIVQTSTWTIVMQVGTFLGYVTFGYMADRFSRKSAYIGYLLIAAALVPLFAFIRDPGMLLFIGPLVGFFGTGYFSGFTVIASELFPTSLRGSAMGFVYNSGRLLSAGAPYIIGGISERAGLSFALCITSVAFLLAALIASALRVPTIKSSPLKSTLSSRQSSTSESIEQASKGESVRKNLLKNIKISP